MTWKYNGKSGSDRQTMVNKEMGIQNFKKFLKQRGIERSVGG
jgi:hypothetical protein